MTLTSSFALPMRHRRPGRVAPAMLLAAALAAPGPAAGGAAPGTGAQEPPEVTRPLPRGKKLILKDGTYHLVREYQRAGERVRYYSTERSAWEELPAALVDWEATEKAAAAEAAELAERAARVREAAIVERAMSIDVDSSIEVAPGRFLPEEPGLWAWDGEQLQPLDQVQVNIKLDKGRLLTQILVPVPIIPTRHRVSIPGRASALRTGPQPEFYIRAVEDHEPELELIRAQVKGGNREVEVITTDIVGQQARQRKTVSVEKWKVARRVWRITLSQTLEPGEYILAGVVEPDQANLFVWEFGVDAGRGAARNRN